MGTEKSYHRKTSCKLHRHFTRRFLGSHWSCSYTLCFKYMTFWQVIEVVYVKMCSIGFI